MESRILKFFFYRRNSEQRFDNQPEIEEPLAQPTSKSHPHLLKDGEVLPGLQLSEFITRRDNLVSEILKSRGVSCNHFIIIPSATTIYMTEKIPYVFRQNSDFKYLTGCLEPDSALLIFINKESYKSVLVLRERNKHSELWEGPRTCPSKAIEYFGVDEAYTMPELPSILAKKLQHFCPYIAWYDYSDMIRIKSFQRMISTIVSDTGAKEVDSPKGAIHQLRLIKSDSEKDLMLESAKIASGAIVEAMKLKGEHITEHQLFATVDYHCRMNGADILAYPPVVAAGNNANTIHYIHNTQLVQNGDLILMDAGCEYHSYCSDITRTWPLDGKFSEHQRVLYEIVLSIQQSLIKKCSEMPSLDSLLKEMCSQLTKKLKEAHVLTQDALCEDSDAVAFKFCPHHVSHYLGMDVHDTATVSRKISVREGMVITVEPGIYINKQNLFAHPEFRGCGIRIEDDIFITNSGPLVLSSCPKSPEEIETIIFCTK